MCAVKWRESVKGEKSEGNAICSVNCTGPVHSGRSMQGFRFGAFWEYPFSITVRDDSLLFELEPVALCKGNLFVSFYFNVHYSQDRPTEQGSCFYMNI